VLLTSVISCFLSGIFLKSVDRFDEEIQAPTTEKANLKPLLGGNSPESVNEV